MPKVRRVPSFSLWLIGSSGKGQGQEDEIQKASSPTGAKMSDMSELSELSEMSDLDDQPPTSPDRQMSIQISPKPLITQFSSRQSASTPPAASKVQSDRRKSTSATKPMEMDPPPGQDTVTSGKSRKRAREESPPPSAQLLKKKKKRFEVDAPSDDQLEAIRVPELPEGTMAEHKARLGELKAQFSCRNKELRDGDQVWALISGFPSWPAQVVVDEGLVPAGSTDAVPVVFFDEGRQR